MSSARELSTMSTPVSGRYELLDKLGEGGMGVVYRALDHKTGTCVALKKIKDISDPTAVNLFTKEWKVLADISHPNIVDVRDVDVIEESGEKKPFFVMPLLKGATLAELINVSSARLTVGRIVEIITQVCKGLQAAHQRGLIHRDLKPSNIFVMEDDTAKIIDFGVVHLAGTRSITGQKGTWQYMSPEQVEAKPCTPASDIFSLGVVCYEALTSRKPFARDTVEETIEAIRKYIPPPVWEINSNANQLVSMVVHKCLAKQPIHRFSSARDLAETLQKAYRNEPIDRFDRAKIQPRIERARTALKDGDEGFAVEILTEIEAEGHLDPEITVLRTQIDTVVRQKKIRQLLESARTRLEQDEIPLALDKVREVLELDSDNADACALRSQIEKQKDQRQISKWLELANQHFERRDFNAARHATQEVLSLRSDHKRALDLLAEIETTEQQARHVRTQKEQLYSSAVKAYQSGEIDSALTKLERILSLARQAPEAAVPERDAVYQSFYKQVRTELDTLRNAYEEARRQFTEKNFAKTIELCESLLVQRPNDPLFQALKLEAIEAERQDLSAYIAEVGTRLESESDLDRRVSILREACERYPRESQFAEQLKLVRERRDLINSIVAKARLYEERDQFVEAVSQWDILRNIHPRYPGIDFEVQQLSRRREQQARDEEKARLITEIEQSIQSGAHKRAIEQASASLQQFAGDAELLSLQHAAEQAQERARESRRLFEDGQRACAEKDYSRGAEAIRSALALEPYNGGYRESLLNALVEQGSALINEDWRKAEPFLDQASELDPTHLTVRALRSAVNDAKRKDFVSRCLGEARELQAAGNLDRALVCVRAGRARYPNDQRLEAYETTLATSAKDAQREGERRRDKAELENYRRRVEQESDAAALKTILQQSQAIRAKYPDEPQIESAAAAVEQAVTHRSATSGELTELLQLSVSRVGGAAVQPKPVSPEPIAIPVIKVERDTIKRTQLWTAIAPLISRGRQLAIRPSIWGSAIAVVVFSIALWWWKHLPPRDKTAATVQVHVQTNPPDAIVVVNGQPVSNGTANVKPHAGNTVEISRIGYKTKSLEVQSDGDWKFALDPEPALVRIINASSIEFDGRAISPLDGGGFGDIEIVPDGATHVLTSTASPAFSITLQAQGGLPTKIVSIVGDTVFVVSAFASEATAYSGASITNASIADRQISPILSTGVSLPITDQDRDLVIGEGGRQIRFSIVSGNAPVLFVGTTNTALTTGTVVLSCSLPNATVALDGEPIKGRRNWQITRAPGTYNVTVSAPGYNAESFRMTLQAGDNLKKSVTLTKSITVAPSAPTAATLTVTGGTPEAEVIFEGKKIGELDANGAGRFENALPIGDQSLTFHRQYYEPKSVAVVSKAGEVRIADLKLVPFARVALSVSPKNARVRYRSLADQQYSSVTGVGPLRLKAGQYELIAEAADHSDYKSTVTLTPGQSLALDIALVPTAAHAQVASIQDPSAVVQESNNWLKAKTPDNFIELRSGITRVDIVFSKPEGPFWKKKKVQWAVVAPGGERLLYDLEDGKLSRRLIAGNKETDRKATNADATSTTQRSSYSVHVHIEQGVIRILNDTRVLLDEFAVPGHDFSGAKIEVRTDSLFHIWPE